MQHVSAGAYLATLTLVTGLPEVVIATIKALAFGLIAGLVGCYRGLTVSGGSKGLGTAVNETVVLCVVALFAVNVVLTTIGVRFGTGMLTCRPFRYCAPASRGCPPRSVKYGEAATKPLDEAGKIGWFAIIGVRDMVVGAHPLPQGNPATDRRGRHGHRCHGRYRWHRRDHRLRHDVGRLAGRDPGSGVVGPHRNRDPARVRRRLHQRPSRRTRSSPASRWQPPSAPAPPPNWVPCESARRSTRWK